MAKHKMTHKMTYEESYDLGYMEGVRIGLIETMRESIIKRLQEISKEHGCKLSKSLMLRIKRETDVPFLRKLFIHLVAETLTIEELEVNHDSMFLTVDEILASKAVF